MADPRTWRCPVERPDCRRKLRPVSWADRHRGLVGGIKVGVTFLVLAALGWWFQYTRVVNLLRASEREALELRDSIRPMVDGLAHEYQTRVADLEKRLSGIGPTAEGMHQVAKLRADAVEFRSGLGKPPRQVVEVKDRLELLGLQVQNHLESRVIKGWDPKAGRLAGGQARTALEEAGREMGGTLEGGYIENLREKYEPRVAELVGAVGQVENALKLWQEACAASHAAK